ncbi:MAG: flagellar biosynthesis protein FlhA [Planctomycetota bacterium]|nr:flagellar biosynthesis protein FlhA [Planctomycetota bacterium]
MVDLRTTTSASAATRLGGLILPVLAAAMVFVLLVPLPPGVMDVLLSASIALSAMVLLTTIFVGAPLEFSVFPTILLVATLFRLVLNIATTRLILTAGAEGRDLAAAQLAAGEVVWRFGGLVTSGSLAVGVILFAMIFLIQFIVITKGATRISEVAARFTLDAMPGKQMAVDAELSSGLIDAQEARRRRRQVAAEADFFGAMDGASKFLRGDALATLVILMVNLLGGLYVGLAQYGWNLSQTAGLFTRLTIGEALVAQVPALLMSISAALIASRSSAQTDLGQEVVKQLTGRPAVLVITAAFLGALTLTSLPKLPLLLIGVGCVGMAIVLTRGQVAAAAAETARAVPAASAPPAGADVESLLTVEPMRIDVGFALVAMVTAPRGRPMLDRIGELRRQIAMELGLLTPAIRILDNMRIGAHEYAIHIRGTKVATGKLWPGKLLAVATERSVGTLEGPETRDPAFGAPAVWIAPDQEAHARQMNCTVVEPESVLLIHLERTIRLHAHELLSRRQVARMLEQLAPGCGDLVDEAREKFGVGRIHRVLQALLGEQVPIRDLESVLEALTEAPAPADDVEALTEHVREALGRAISQKFAGDDGKLWCVSVDESLAQAISANSDDLGGRRGLTMPPAVGDRIVHAVGDALERLRADGRQPVVLCSPRVRGSLRQLLAGDHPDAAVIGYNEVHSVEVQSVESVGLGT